MGGEFFTGLRQFDIDHVSELVLRVISDPNYGGGAFDTHPFVVLAVVKILWNVCHDAPQSFQGADLRSRSLFITYAFRTRPIKIALIWLCAFSILFAPLPEIFCGSTFSFTQRRKTKLKAQIKRN